MKLLMYFTSATLDDLKKKCLNYIIMRSSFKNQSFDHFHRCLDCSLSKTSKSPTVTAASLPKCLTILNVDGINIVSYVDILYQDFDARF